MPRGDGTGPMGNGPRDGRGANMANVNNANSVEVRQENVVQDNAYGARCNRMRRGRGMGCGRNAAPAGNGGLGQNRGAGRNAGAGRSAGAGRNGGQGRNAVQGQGSGLGRNGGVGRARNGAGQGRGRFGPNAN